MFSEETSALRRFLRRHARMILFGLTVVPLTHGVLSGLLVPGLLDFGLVAVLVIRRFGLLRTFVTTFVLLFGVLPLLIPPMCGGSRHRAYAAAIKSDLKNLASQQEIYYSDSYVYTTSAPDLGFVHSDGVSVTVVSVGTGWAAWGSHAALGKDEGCAIFYGDIPESMRTVGAITPQHAGEIACTDID